MSVVLAPRRTVYGFARLGLPRLLRKIAAFFAAPDAAVRPQTFENHLRSAGDGSSVFAIGNAEAGGVLQQALEFLKLLATLRGACQTRQLQLPPQLRPQHGRP